MYIGAIANITGASVIDIHAAIGINAGEIL